MYEELAKSLTDPKCSWPFWWRWPFSPPSILSFCRLSMGETFPRHACRFDRARADAVARARTHECGGKSHLPSFAEQPFGGKIVERFNLREALVDENTVNA